VTIGSGCAVTTVAAFATATAVALERLSRWIVLGRTGIPTVPAPASVCPSATVTAGPAVAPGSALPSAIPDGVGIAALSAVAALSAAQSVTPGAALPAKGIATRRCQNHPAALILDTAIHRLAAATCTATLTGNRGVDAVTPRQSRLIAGPNFVRLS